MAGENPRLFARVEEAFHRVMEGPEDGREARARELCADDPTLLEEVLSLLAGARGAALDRPAVDVAAVMGRPPPGVEDDGLVGARVGEFLLERRLGAGGMGVVYLARQDNPSRGVAIKVMRPGSVGVRRFEEEAQILGRLQHPGIAQVYGAGRVRLGGQDLPYMAMEFVRGAPLTEFVRSRDLPLRGRTELVAAVCDAVQHAHAKGVIHRDLKPANILVSEPAAGVVLPKVLDFGVARLADPAATHTAWTTAGEIVGTLPYMSPEQVRGEAGEVDTRADVYALGVVLYEVLSGRRPVDLSGRGLAEAIPLILESEPAPLGTLDRRLRGDLEVVAAHALEKDKSRRYQSAAELAADLRRVLADEPITARPPTAAYQLRKFARRNRALVAGASAAVVLLVAGVVGTTVGLVRARESLAVADRTVDFLSTILTSANPAVSRGRDLTVREVVDEAAARAGSELAGRPEVEFRTRLALSRTYLALGVAAAARAQGDRALALASQVFGPRTVEASEAMAAVAAAGEQTDKSEASVAAAREVLELRLDLLQPEDRRVALARMGVAKALSNLSRFDEAEKELTEAYRVLKVSGDRGAGSCAGLLSDLMMRALGGKRLAEAAALMEPTVAWLRQKGPQAEPELATALISLGSVYTRQGRHTDAEAALAEAVAVRGRIFPASHPAVFGARLRMVAAMRQPGQAARAREAASALLADELKALGPASPEVVNTYGLIARACEELKDFAGAAEAYGHAAESAALLKDPASVQIWKQAQAQSLVDAGLASHAEGPLRQALEITRASGRRGLHLVTLNRELATVMKAAGRHAERAAAVREALAFAEGGPPAPPVLASELRAELAAALADAGGLEEAERLYREALRGLAELAPGGRRRNAAAEELAGLLERLGRGEEAARVRTEHAGKVAPGAEETPGAVGGAVHGGGV